MKIYHSLSEFTPLPNAVVTTGTFDGVHIGHKEILKRVVSIAKKTGGESVLLTFFPHPRIVLNPGLELKLITNLEEKSGLIEKTGIDHLIILPFTKAFSRTTSIDFVREILVQSIGAKKLVIGYDHQFGRNREGSFEHLKEYGPLYGFEVEEISAQELEEVKVSSTKIRKALLEGKVEIAKKYLGHSFTLTGDVVKGQNLGEKIGFATANIEINDDHKIIPANGAYAVKVEYNNALLPGMCNIGFRPTLNGTHQTIEVNLFNFSENLYGKRLKVHFFKFIRPERKFEDLEALKAQLEKDKHTCQRLLGQS